MTDDMTLPEIAVAFDLLCGRGDGRRQLSWLCTYYLCPHLTDCALMVVSLITVVRNSELYILPLDLVLHRERGREMTDACV